MSKIIDPVPQSQTLSTTRTLPRRTEAVPQPEGHLSAMALAAAITSRAEPGDMEPVLEIEQLVAVILQTCHRLGRRPHRLRPLIARELARHCAQGDATALVLRSWIDRSTPFDQQVANVDMRREG